MVIKTVPVRTDDGCWNLELAGERPPRFGQELLGMPAWSASVAVIVCAVLRPNGVAVAVRAFGLEEPAVVIKLARLVDIRLLHQRHAPVHLAVGSFRPAAQRQRSIHPRCADDVLPLGVLVRLLAAGAGGAAGLDGVSEAVDADPELALAGEDVVAAAVAHDLGVASLHHAAAGPLAAGAPAAGTALVHDVRAGDAVEAAGEERAGDVLLVGCLGNVLVHGLVVRRHRDVDVVVLEVHAADLRVQVVARVADEATGVGPTTEHHSRS